MPRPGMPHCSGSQGSRCMGAQWSRMVHGSEILCGLQREVGVDVSRHQRGRRRSLLRCEIVPVYVPVLVSVPVCIDASWTKFELCKRYVSVRSVCKSLRQDNPDIYFRVSFN